MIRTIRTYVRGIIHVSLTTQARRTKVRRSVSRDRDGSLRHSRSLLFHFTCTSITRSEISQKVELGIHMLYFIQVKYSASMIQDIDCTAAAYMYRPNFMGEFGPNGARMADISESSSSRSSSSKHQSSSSPMYHSSSSKELSSSSPLCRRIPPATRDAIVPELPSEGTEHR